MGLAACAALIGARRVPRELLAGCAALAVEGYATLVHSGGAINDMLPAYLAVALLAGLALGSGQARPSTGRLVTTVAGVLVLAQSVFLLASSHPSRAIPTSADRAAGERLVAGMRALGGDVAVPERPQPEPAGGNDAGRAPGRGVRRRAGHRPGRDRELPAQRRRGGQGPAVQRDHQRRRRAGRSSTRPISLEYYQECLQPLPAGPATLLVPVAGNQPRPAVVWIPRERFLPARPQHPERR